MGQTIKVPQYDAQPYLHGSKLTFSYYPPYYKYNAGEPDDEISGQLNIFLNGQLYGRCEITNLRYYIYHYNDNFWKAKTPVFLNGDTLMNIDLREIEANVYGFHLKETSTWENGWFSGRVYKPHFYVVIKTNVGEFKVPDFYARHFTPSRRAILNNTFPEDITNMILNYD